MQLMNSNHHLQHQTSTARPEVAAVARAIYDGDSDILWRISSTGQVNTWRHDQFQHPDNH